ncbi:hypothetical protein N9W89_10045 [Hellea sp.]|nr:hypothetical protein [Hellea sp.]
MKTAILISAAMMLSACSTMKTGAKVVKTTGKVAASSGKVVYRAGVATGKAVVGVGKGTAAVFNNTTSTDTVQNMTMSPEPEHIDNIGDKNSFGEVMLSPLEDMNLRKQRIPKKLTDLRSAYARLPVTNCDTILAEIVTFDDILGPDLDSVRFESEEGRAKRIRREAALDISEAGVRSFVPFRGIVRAASGATRHENNIRRAFRKGMARRGYLRGLYDARGCNNRLQ